MENWMGSSHLFGTIVPQRGRRTGSVFCPHPFRFPCSVWQYWQKQEAIYSIFLPAKSIYAEKYIDLYFTLLHNNNYTVFKTKICIFYKRSKGFKS